MSPIEREVAARTRVDRGKYTVCPKGCGASLNGLLKLKDVKTDVVKLYCGRCDEHFTVKSEDSASKAGKTAEEGEAGKAGGD